MRRSAASLRGKLFLGQPDSGDLRQVQLVGGAGDAAVAGWSTRRIAVAAASALLAVAGLATLLALSWGSAGLAAFTQVAADVAKALGGPMNLHVSAALRRLLGTAAGVAAAVAVPVGYLWGLRRADSSWRRRRIRTWSVPTEVARLAVNADTDLRFALKSASCDPAVRAYAAAIRGELLRLLDATHGAGETGQVPTSTADFEALARSAARLWARTAPRGTRAGAPA